MITNEQVGDVLVAAFEGGSNYWITSVEIKGDMLGDFASDHVGNGGDVTINVLEDKPELLTRAKMRRGIKRAASDFGVSEERWFDQHDADLADVALQFAVFDQVVYG